MLTLCKNNEYSYSLSQVSSPRLFIFLMLGLLCVLDIEFLSVRLLALILPLYGASLSHN